MKTCSLWAVIAPEAAIYETDVCTTLCKCSIIVYICGIIFKSGINNFQLNGSEPQQLEFYAFGHISYAVNAHMSRADMLYVHIRVTCGQTCHLGANQL